jgi:hypothetical protein
MSYTALKEGLGYEGKVTLTLKNNGHVLKSRTYKNNGTVELFKFLGNCLVSKFTEAEKLLPNQILLLSNKSSQPLPANAKTDIEPQSEFIGLAQTPSIVDDPDTESVKVTYNFEVPNQSIHGPFNQIALYGAGKIKPTLEVKEFSAYYFLADNGKFDEINPESADWSATTILLIDWELSISNKNIVTEITGNTGEEV